MQIDVTGSGKVAKIFVEEEEVDDGAHLGFSTKGALGWAIFFGRFHI